jgi:hypothetical protein
MKNKLSTDAYKKRKNDIIREMNEKRQRQRDRALKVPKKDRVVNLDPTMLTVAEKRSGKQRRFEKAVASAQGKAVKGLSRKADKRGLPEAERIESKPAPKYETELRDGESMIAFLNRLNKEKNDHMRENKKTLRATNPRKIAYNKERRMRAAEKILDKKIDEQKEKEFYGVRERIAFGDIVERPPSFDDISLPTNKKAAARSSNLAILTKALAQADADVKAKYGDLVDATGAEEEEQEEDEEAAKRPRKISQQERAKLLADARQNQRKAEVEKARLQAQMAYRDLKAKRGHKGMAALATHGETLRVSTQTAMQALQSVDED